MAPDPIAFVTCEALPGIPEDQAAADILAKRGVAVVPAVWSDPAVDWASFRLVILRSTWDYYERYAAFSAWLDRMEAQRVPLLNTVATARWNSRKTYLLDLQARGAPIIPTVLATSEAAPDLALLMQNHGWDSVVLKPAVSAGAYGTAHFIQAEAAQRHLQQLINAGPALIQPFMPQINTHGEVSLVYFNGRFSHAVIKHPKAADFRVQEMHGGQTLPWSAPASVQAQAAAVLALVEPTPLYARVDGLLVDGQLTLMELELLEPSLYVECDPGAAANFAEAVMEHLR